MQNNSAEPNRYDSKLSFMEVRDRLVKLSNLPAMPTIAAKLLKLSSNERANIYDLVGILETDPSLVAQLIRYAKSAYFGYRGNIESIEQAVVSVLGYRLALNISLGISLGKEFTHMADGPMGIMTFWRHSIYHAVLMEHWQLPTVVQNVVLNHHNPNFDGAYSNYVKLAYLSDSVLNSLQEDYSYHEGQTDAVLKSLHISDIDIRTAAAKLGELKPDLDRLATRLAA